MQSMEAWYQERFHSIVRMIKLSEWLPACQLKIQSILVPCCSDASSLFFSVLSTPDHEVVHVFAERWRNGIWWHVLAPGGPPPFLKRMKIALNCMKSSMFPLLCDVGLVKSYQKQHVLLIGCIHTSYSTFVNVITMCLEQVCHNTTFYKILCKRVYISCHAHTTPKCFITDGRNSIAIFVVWKPFAWNAQWAWSWSGWITFLFSLSESASIHGTFSCTSERIVSAFQRYDLPAQAFQGLP